MKIENYHGDIRDILIALDEELQAEGCTGEDWIILDDKTAIIVVRIKEEEE